MIGRTLVSTLVVLRSAELDAKFYSLSVPHFIQHYVVWTRRPLIHPGLVPPALWPRLQQDGLWGFNGSDYVRKPLQGLSEEETQIILNAGREIELFVLREWKEDDYETAWFANPPVSSYLVVISCVSSKDSNLNVTRDYKVFRDLLISTFLHDESQTENQLPQTMLPSLARRARFSGV